jgi:ubiquinone/menaquinone biosynthesis C-methylase UbiE
MRSTDVDFRRKHSRLEVWDSYVSPLEQPYGRFVLDVLSAGGSDWVLDDGCGNGRFAEALAATACRVVALDISEALTNIARNRCRNNSVHVIRADMTHLPFRTSIFDRVLCVNDLWYVKRFREAIHEMNRVLKIDGKCVVDQLNFFGVWNLGNLTNWRFYWSLLKSLAGKAFVDVGRSYSDFVTPFEKMRCVVFSVNILPELEVREGYHTFASRFLISATKTN